MRDILDPADLWLGTPIGAQLFDNKRPVAIDDTVVIVKDSGPVTIDVLANDFDPEGDALLVISASAALGTALVASDNTVTYTPPPGLSGFDTVTYEIADAFDQRRAAQINITITEPQLSIETRSDNTLVIESEIGLLDLSVSQPAEFAGNWQVDTDDLAGGPVNLLPPEVTGVVTTGDVLDATNGLWLYDTDAGTPIQAWQWQRGQTAIPGETAQTYTVTGADIGPGISIVETQTDAFGQRSTTSAVVGGSFMPSDDPVLLGWWDAADTGTITASGAAVTGWEDKAGGPDMGQINTAWRPTTGTRTLNGMNVIDFDGAQKFLEANRSFPASGNMAFHAALVLDGTASAFAALLAIEATNDFQLDAGSDTQFDGRLNASGIGSTTALTGGPFFGAIILSLIFDRTGAAQAQVFIGDTQRASMGYSAAIDATAALHLMTNRSRNAWIDGALAEVIITGDVTNRAQHHGYLAAKWGLS